MSEYIYDTSLEDEHTRLHALEAVLDPGSIRVLDTIGIESSWRCLEVGGGGGSIAGWLSDRAAHVVATDLDTRFLKKIRAANLEVRTHNIVTDPLETDSFDLIHSRDVLEHIPEREVALDKMVAALKPGGWLVAEDVDFTEALRVECFGEVDELGRLEGRSWAASTAGMRKRGVEPEYGRRLPWRLAARGLVDIQGDVRAWLIKAGTMAAELYKLSIDQLRPLFVEGGMSEDDVARLRAYVYSDEFIAWGPIHMAAWGRKPA